MFSLYIKLTISWIYYEELKVYSCEILYQIWTKKSYLYWYRCWEDCILFNFTLRIFHWYSAFACEGCFIYTYAQRLSSSRVGYWSCYACYDVGPLFYYITSEEPPRLIVYFGILGLQGTCSNSDHHEKKILV